MIEKKHNLIYQITNLVNGKIYIGRHSTDRINDNYFGSGKEICKEVVRLGKDSFKKEILFNFPTGQEMIDKEIELLTREFVEREDNYNLGSGQGGVFTHGEEARQKLRKANTGFLTAKDKDGNTFRISKDDPRYLSGELKHNLHGLVRVRDFDGNTFCIPIDDPRRLTGELISAVTGTKRPEETIKKHIEFMKSYWSENKHSDQAIEKMRDSAKGKVNVKDIDGNCFRVDKNDPRIESGELTYTWTGRKKSRESRQKNSELKRGCIWVSNLELEKTKLVRPEEVEKYITDGWIKYRIWFQKPNWKSKLEQYLTNSKQN